MSQAKGGPCDRLLACGLLLVSMFLSAGCGGRKPQLPEGHPTGVVSLPTSESACSSQRAACHAIGAAPPPEIATAMAAATGTPESVPTPTTTPEPVPLSTVAEAGEAEPDGDSEHGAYHVEWGGEVSFDEMLELGKQGSLTRIEWYALPNAARLILADGSFVHVKNEKWGRSVKKELDAVGVDTSRRGVPIYYYFCD